MEFMSSVRNRERMFYVGDDELKKKKNSYSKENFPFFVLNVSNCGKSLLHCQHDNKNNNKKDKDNNKQLFSAK